MSSLKADFEELRERIRHGRELGHASFEPIYYLVFHPSRILEVKRETPAWIAKLRNDNWEVDVLSMADEIAAILDAHPLRKFWVAGDHKAPLDWAKTNQSLRQALTQGDALLKRVGAALERLSDKSHGVLLVTDLEALHPYLRIGAIEGRLQGKFHVPTIFLYPGVRSGKTRLSFLGFYPEDGNYRSVHVGG